MDGQESELRRALVPWPTRAMAAIAATAVAVWLTVHVLGSAPIPPALMGLAAGAAVLVSPRGGWLALSGITVILAVIEGHAGLAVVTVLALALPVLVMWRSAGAWPLAAGAPALGLIGLAGAWPALAARANTPWQRAGLAGIGWIWLALAAPVLDRVLYLPAIGGIPPSAEWGGSVTATANQMLSPVLRSGVLAPALVWALAALILPWLVRGRRAAVDLVRVAIWSVTLAGCDRGRPDGRAWLRRGGGRVDRGGRGGGRSDHRVCPAVALGNPPHVASGASSDWPWRTISVAWISPKGVPMSVLRSLESKIAGLVEGTFSRAFKSEVRPVEIARKLSREMEEHKSVSLSRTYVPNEYRVYLSPRDRERFADYEEALASELAGYLLEHARSERLALMSRPVVEFETDDRLRLGEFGIQTKVVNPQDPEEPEPVAEESGRTMVYSSAGRVAGPLEERAHARHQSALLITDGRRLVVGPGGATVGRSRRCDVMLDDANVSRTHAEIRPRGGSWVLTDLGSTNGSRLNGRRLDGSEVLKPGDEIELGTSRLTFELE